jgi:hypothetical protein
MLLSGDLGIFDPLWAGWIIRDGELVSPEGWRITRNDVLSAPLLRAQVATYQRENRKLRRALDIDEFPEEQPLPSADLDAIKVK